MLDEPRLIYARPADAGVVRLPGLDGPELLARVRGRWRGVLAMALAGAALAYLWSVASTPVFTATTEIFIDPRSIQALDMSAGQNQADNNAQVSFVESQTRVVTSEGVLSRVVAARNLAEDPSFDGEAAPASLSGLAQRLGLIQPRARSTADRARSALMALADRVTVRRPERTFVMDVSVKANSADGAAALANAMAQAYFDEQNAAHAEMARRAASSLTSRLDDLRGRVQQAEAKVQAFKIEQDLVGTRAQLSSEQQLTDANAQLAQAQARAVNAQARVDQAYRLSAARLEGETPEAVASPTIALLRGQEAEAKRRLDNALEQLGPRHPTVHDAQAEVAGLQRSIKAELARIGQSAQVELRRATTAVAAQRSEVERLSQQAQRTSGALVQLNQLEREVDINKNLLDTFLSRSKQVGELAGLDTTDGRVISAALPPLQRSFPPRGLTMLLIGGFLGLAAGIGLAIRPTFARARI